MFTCLQTFKNNSPTVKSTLYLSYLLIGLLSCCSIFLFPIGTKFFSIPLFTIILVIIAQKIKIKKHILKSLNLKTDVYPWLPFAFTTTTLAFAHGLNGYSIYFTCLALFFLSKIALQDFYIPKKLITYLLSTSLLVCNFAIIFYLYCYELGTYIFDINRNILLCGLTLIFSATFGAVLSSHKSYTKTEMTFLCFCGFLYLIVLSMTQVRTAILGLIALFPICVTFLKKSPKTILILFSVLILLVISFFMTERLQQGLYDLELWCNGNPNTSWGIRLELWKFSISGFVEHPFFGWGPKPFHEMIDSGLNWTVPSFDSNHFHSDFFNNLVSNGLIGTTGWFFTIFLLSKFFRNNSALMCLLITSLAMGLSERIWFDNKACLPIFICLWVIFSLSPKTQPKGEN